MVAFDPSRVHGRRDQEGRGGFCKACIRHFTSLAHPLRQMLVDHICCADTIRMRLVGEWNLLLTQAPACFGDVEKSY